MIFSIFKKLYLKGKPDDIEEEKINFIISNLANDTNLIVNEDIVKMNYPHNKIFLEENSTISNIDENNQTLGNIYEYLENNQGKVQYMVVFCFSE